SEGDEDIALRRIAASEVVFPECGSGRVVFQVEDFSRKALLQFPEQVHAVEVGNVRDFQQRGAIFRDDTRQTDADLADLRKLLKLFVQYSQKIRYKLAFGFGAILGFF